MVVLKEQIQGDGVWRIRRSEKSPVLEVFKIEESGYGGILSDEFVEWRLHLQAKKVAGMLG